MEVADEGEAEPPRDAPEERAKRLRGLPGSGEVILVVDDDANLRIALGRLLKSLGFATLTAADGHDALEVLKRSVVRIDAVLLDVVMPGLDGPGLVEQLGYRGLHPRILYMSGHEDPPAVLRALLSGAPLLRKPFTPKALVYALRELLDAET